MEIGRRWDYPVEASSSRWGRAWIGKEKERVVSSLEEMGAGD